MSDASDRDGIVVSLCDYRAGVVGLVGQCAEHRHCHRTSALGNSLPNVKKFQLARIIYELAVELDVDLKLVLSIAASDGS